MNVFDKLFIKEGESCPRPQKSGLYFARTKDCSWYNLVVYLVGEVPFLKLDSIIYLTEEEELITEAEDVYEWGPEIEHPQDKLG